MYAEKFVVFLIVDSVLVVISVGFLGRLGFVLLGWVEWAGRAFGPQFAVFPEAPSSFTVFYSEGKITRSARSVRIAHIECK